MSVNFCTVTQHSGLADADLLVEYRCFSFQMKDVGPYLARRAHTRKRLLVAEKIYLLLLPRVTAPTVAP
ncbi:hypothetical protein B5K03_16895 [Rhizobium phaseoli]|nr:hypothetical protein B5K03_16895 [Rhizobium phaseoli]